jgi:acetoacetate decarboxylase
MFERAIASPSIFSAVLHVLPLQEIISEIHCTCDLTIDTEEALGDYLNDWLMLLLCF